MSPEVPACPSCGAAEVDDRFGFTDGFCGACGFVLDKDNIEQSKPAADDSDTQPSLEIDDWIESVTPRDSSESVLVELLATLDRSRTDLYLTESELDDSTKLLVKTWEKSLFHGRKAEHVIGAVLIITLRQAEAPRPIGVIAESLGCERTAVQRTMKKLKREFDLALFPPVPENYLPFLARKLALNEATVKDASRILDRFDSGSGDPACTAAAALYLAAKPQGTSVTYDSAARAAGSTKETVWRRSQSLTDCRNP